MIAGAVVCVFAVLFFVKWSFGHTISTRAEQKEIAEYERRACAGRSANSLFIGGFAREKFSARRFGKVAGGI